MRREQYCVLFDVLNILKGKDGLPSGLLFVQTDLLFGLDSIHIESPLSIFLILFICQVLLAC
jgi:hypothetical protein